MSDSEDAVSQPQSRAQAVIIAGVMKSGTTTLHQWLSSARTVVACRAKEPHFFSHKWHRGVDWYEALFPPAPAEALLLESSQSYSDPDLASVVVARLREVRPSVRLVFVLRHPIARMRSEYRHQVQRGREKRLLSECLAAGGTKYVRRSMYRTCLDPFLTTFPRDQMAFFRFEDLVSADDREWRRVLQFLDLPYFVRPPVSVQTTRTGTGWRRGTELLVRAGAASVAERVPKRVRRLLRPIFLREDRAYRRLLESSAAEPGPEVLGAVWEDVARMESWLGASRWWVRQV